MKRIGLWGGSFNPPTLAHQALAEYAFSALNLHELLWIVTPHNPEKDVQSLAPFAHRLAMVKQVLVNDTRMQVSDIEQRLGSSLTVNTVKYFRECFAEDHLYFLMGADNWLGYHGWGQDRHDIFDYVSLIIFNRPGCGRLEEAAATREFAERRVDQPRELKKSGTWCLIDNPLYDISATTIRRQLTLGELPTDLAPETLKYIRIHGLYAIDAQHQ
jgi:nicotinate-nucleotide adenylyltransferase